MQIIRELYEKNPNTVVVFVNSRPLCEPWIAENIPAIIEAWEPGCMGGQALAEIIKGDVNSSGKLPVSIPYTAGQVVYTYNHKPSHYFRKYVDVPSGPLWSFGQGGSYTTFEYRDLQVTPQIFTKEDTLSVSVSLENTGKMDGDEVVQLYIRDDFSTLTRPVKELIDFRRVFIEW